MKKIEKKSKSQVENSIRQWCACRYHDIHPMFEQWVNKEGKMVNPDKVDSSGALGYLNQYSRLLGIDFGEISDDFKSEVKKIANAQKSMESEGSTGVVPSLTMELGVNDSVFTIYLKTSYDGIETYWEAGGNQSHIYDIRPMPERNLARRYGISTTLRNQFAYNWLILPPFMTGDLFFALSIPKAEQPAKNSKDHDHALVRALHYNITGQNLQALNELLNTSSTPEKKQGLKLRFGANLSDFLTQKDIFTIIIEVDGNYSTDISVDEMTYLEFVGGCPPACPDDD